MKAPPNIPKVGEDCELRGKPGRIGSVVNIDHSAYSYPLCLWVGRGELILHCRKRVDRS